ncbi:hypothetical protein UlMin_034410 [Ulmus minor]
MLEPLPPINKIFSLVIQEERQRSMSFSSSVPPISTAYGVASSNYNAYKGKRDKPVCTNCGYFAHTVDKCYKKHGYPPGFTPKGQSTSYSKDGSPNKWTTGYSKGGSPNKWSPGYSKATVAQTSILVDSNNSTVNSSYSLSNLCANQCQDLISLLSTQLQGLSRVSSEQQQAIVSNFNGKYSGPKDWDE